MTMHAWSEPGTRSGTCTGAHAAAVLYDLQAWLQGRPGGGLMHCSAKGRPGNDKRSPEAALIPYQETF